MLDINIIREDPERELDERRRGLIQQVEALKAERNAVSKEIGRMKDPAERQAKIDAMRQVGDRISALDEELRQVENDLTLTVAMLPNFPDPRVPYGKDDSENVVLRTCGEPP